MEQPQTEREQIEEEEQLAVGTTMPAGQSIGDRRHRPKFFPPLWLSRADQFVFSPRCFCRCPHTLTLLATFPLIQPPSRPLTRLQSKLRLPSVPTAVCPQHLVPLHLTALQMRQLKADPAQLRGVQLVGKNVACVSAGAPLAAFKMTLSRLAMQSPATMTTPHRSLLAHSAAKLQRLRLKTYLAAVQLASMKARLSAGAAAESTGIAQMELKLKKLQTHLAKAEAHHAALLQQMEMNAGVIGSPVVEEGLGAGLTQQQHSALKLKLPATAALPAEPANFDTQGQSQ